MTRIALTHVTTYRYGAPVTLGEHKMMFRPRDSHDLHIVEATLVLSPVAEVRWMHDVFGNSITIADFQGASTDFLRFESKILLDHFGLSEPAYPIAAYAETFPFTYDADLVADLGRTNERHYPDPDHRLDAWARRFLDESGETATLEMLSAMNRAISAEFSYAARDTEGTQTPLETLERGSGSCRDFALLMMEAVRSLGLATRFVSGYLYDPALDGRNANGTVGAGATHAWLQVYLPGAGWVEFDPTNALVGGENLIRVAVTRDPAQAVPITGSFAGPGNAFLSMEVEVTLRRQDQDSQVA
ncbi:transglutaminase [Rhodospirillum rubrum]|uniref:transglutaminase family protein n=1 Tax=Rhodospirillum rubrum TaxID=1085 RepID=UPI001904FE8A|nr:transglutaminase family protein [Rhodospirillum rubrum]MBK1664166.1 transglutaminase [Rhodospirillum rubrum]MBK1675813.1 transglutaminase [Rhodospirillum rubrum]